MPLSQETPHYSSAVDGLKRLYSQQIKPIEDMYKFETFYSAPLTDGDIEALPMVMLLGQYSTGKTSFIEYLIDSEYPGAHIGPEPTTDRFVAVMHGREDRIIPGNAAASQQDKPFTGLNKFGNAFLTKFQISSTPSEFLGRVCTLIDTPGVLSGEKQRIGRSYDFVKVTEWFYQRCDLILLLFDAHKLDISDEFKRVIQALRGNEDKVRIILNKADTINEQQLMRVYGALMWSLGKVVASPEVMRVYIGSFWKGSSSLNGKKTIIDTNHHRPEEHSMQAALIKAEQNDLLKELNNLPRNSALRKINEMIKRAKLARVHCFIIAQLRKEMPALFGKASKQAALLKDLESIYTKVHRLYSIPPGDFPDVEKFRDSCKLFDFSSLPKLNSKLADGIEWVLEKELPRLISLFPPDASPFSPVVGSENLSTNSSNSNAIVINPFNGEISRGWIDFNQEERFSFTHYSSVNVNKHSRTFHSLHPAEAIGNNKEKIYYLTADKLKGFLMESKLPNSDLAVIWNLADASSKDGRLDEHEFSIAMHLIEIRLLGGPLFEKLPPGLLRQHV